MTSSSSLRATAQAAPSAIPSEGPAAPASLWQLVGSSARAALLVMLIAGVAYPLLTTGVAQILFPHAANGSLIERDGQAVGSALVGQQFASDAYFQGRPSATLGADPAQLGASVPAPYNAGASGASNQGATHQGLSDVVAQRVDQYRAVNGLAAQVAVPVDAVTASASGLDPHISLANAQLQVARVAKARGLLPDQVQQLVQDHTRPRTLFLLGEPRVHVLQLNLALDAAAPTTAANKE